MLRNRNARPPRHRQASTLSASLAVVSFGLSGWGMAQERPAFGPDAGFAGSTLPTFVQFENRKRGVLTSGTHANSPESWRLLLDPTPLAPLDPTASRFEPPPARNPATASVEPTTPEPERAAPAASPRSPDRAPDATAATSAKDPATAASSAKAPRSPRREEPVATGTAGAAKAERPRAATRPRAPAPRQQAKTPLPNVLRLEN